MLRLSAEWHVWAIVDPGQRHYVKPKQVSVLRPESTGMRQTIREVQRILQDEAGQDIAEYAVMLAVILRIVIGTVKLIGMHAHRTLLYVASNLGPGGEGSNACVD